jgi:hypothetical protein
VLLLGVIGGLLGSCFTHLNEGLADWRKRGALTSARKHTVECHCQGPNRNQMYGCIVATATWGACCCHSVSTNPMPRLGCLFAVLLPHGTRGRLWEALAAALLTSTVSFVVPMLVACQVRVPVPSRAVRAADSVGRMDLLSAYESCIKQH